VRHLNKNCHPERSEGPVHLLAAPNAQHLYEESLSLLLYVVKY
jgi:hypothetical protein